MSRVAGVLVRVVPGAGDAVRPCLAAFEGVQIVESADHGFALVLEAPDARAQEEVHDRVRAVPGVVDAVLVFQSGEVESDA